MVKNSAHGIEDVSKGGHLAVTAGSPGVGLTLADGQSC